ncbi:MAG TPA: DsbA family protein [Solirubrobacteraceae bacterium]|nr:DsbA family protein [Solirubrobacteraceae bacterium]
MDGPAFYFDLGSPDAYLAAERVIQTLPVATEWIGVLARDLPGAESFEAFRCAEERSIVLGEYEARAARRGLQPLRWPEPFPFETGFAMRAATYAKSIGKAVPFALAAFRQAFAGGRPLDREDNVLIAASACEMHPRALLQGAATKGTAEALARATALAAERGVRDVPAVWTGEEVFHGERDLERAAAALAQRAGAAR